MKRYVVLDYLHHDGILYEPGTTVLMDETRAAHLQRLGVLGQSVQGLTEKSQHASKPKKS